MDGLDDLLSTQPPSFSVHPLAALFPLMTDDELAELAADIKANGLVHPLMLDAPGKVLIDGRNRLKACELAEVAPRFERLARGQDPRAFIVSVNLARRNLTKGQQAMALAMIYPEPAKLKRAGSSVAKDQNVSEARLSQARTVLREARDLADLVLAGSQSLDEAYTEAQRRRAAADSEEAQMARLRNAAPDVAELVIEGKITLAAGLEEVAQRARRRQETIDAAKRALGQITGFAAQVLTLAAGREEGEALPITEIQFENVSKGFELLTTLYKEQGKGNQ